MKNKIFSLFVLMLVALTASAQEKPKYVFYFIGDGMGVNQVNATETYLGALDGRIGIQELCFASFPEVAIANTQSATNGVTDSAAGGTALATGNKTKNGALGVLKDLTTEVSSVASWAKKAGAEVGITTSVSIDHATPASFYAHVGNRGESYKIGQQLTKSGFDFFAASDFVKPNGKQGEPSLYEQAKENGYTIVRSYKEYLKKAKKAEKMILFQSEEASKADKGSIPYAIDRKKGDLTLQDITRAAIHFLSKDAPNGFFLMVEGGKIDWACHSNDGAAAIQEVIDFDNAIKVAYEFYSQHPDETLIVVTADHSTGGMALGTGSYDLNLQVLKNQKVSEEKFTKILNGLRKKTNNKVTWEMAQQALKENFGFWGEVKVGKSEEERLKKVYERSFQGEAAMEKSEYSQSEPLAAEAKRIINAMAKMGWQSGGHSNGYVPVFAIGAGAEAFDGRIDNTEIPKRIAKVAGWQAQ